MKLSQQAVRTRLVKRIPATIVKEIINYVCEKNTSLWGEEQGRDFTPRCVILALYKDVYKIGYTALYKSVKKWLGCCEKSLRHNTRVLRRVFKEWAKTKIFLGDLASWRRRAVRRNFTGFVEGACLWFDSFDLKKEGMRTTSRKGPDWSYKLNAPGVRFMILRDASGRIRKVWGGYSPKVFDGDFLKINRDWLEENLMGATVLADQHFEWGRKHIDSVTFITPHKTPARRANMEGTGQLTAQQKHDNETLHAARATVELAIGRLVGTFEALQHHWRESDEQLACLVWTAAAICDERH